MRSTGEMKRPEGEKWLYHQWGKPLPEVYEKKAERLAETLKPRLAGEIHWV